MRPTESRRTYRGIDLKVIITGGGQLEEEDTELLAAFAEADIVIAGEHSRFTLEGSGYRNIEAKQTSS